MATSNSQSSQSVTSAYIVRRAFTGLLSDGAQLGGVLFLSWYLLCTANRYWLWYVVSLLCLTCLLITITAGRTGGFTAGSEVPPVGPPVYGGVLSPSGGNRGQTLWVPGCKYTWGDFGDYWGGIPSWCPIWGGRPVLDSSHRAESIPMVPLDFF